MTTVFDRRRLLIGGAAIAAPLCLPAPLKAAATVSAATPYERKVLDVAAQHRDRVAQHLWRTNLVGIADFARPSWEPRMHLANLEDGTVRSYLLTHGRGSDPEHDGWLKTFSQTPGSEATSRGAYLTCEWYKGKYGTSVRLVGLDPDNATALERLIVIHQAWYAEREMVGKWGKLGRSEGCFALGQEAFGDILYRLSGGCLLFADQIGDA